DWTDERRRSEEGRSRQRRGWGGGWGPGGERERTALAGRAELAQGGVFWPADALAHGHDGPAAGTAVQRDVVHAGPHDGQAAARFGQLGDRYLQRVRLLRLAQAQADPVVGHLDLAADRAEAGDHRVVAYPASAVGEHVGAGFGGREQDVVY